MVKSFFSAAVLLFLIFSCEPQKRPAAPLPPVQTPPAAPPPVPPKTPLPPGPPPPPVMVFDEGILRGKEFLLQRQSGQDHPLPRDFDLGPLANPADGGVLSSCEALLKALEKKTVPPEYFADRWRIFLTQQFKANEEAYGPVTAFRLGLPRQETTGEVQVPVLLKGQSWTLVRFYFMQKGEAWVLTDLQGDWSAMKAGPADTPRGNFDPENPPQLK